MGRWTAAAFLRAYADALGEFFLVAFFCYGFILAVGFGLEFFGRYREAVSKEAPGEAQTRTAQPRSRRLEIRSRGRVRYVEVERIDWIEAEGSYVRLHVGESSLLYRRTLSGLTEELGEPFARIHRSAAVNVERIDEMRPVSHGEAVVRLSTGKELKVSRSYRQEVEPLLGRSDPPA